MTRQLLSFCSGACLPALLPAPDARAVEMPVRKAGLNIKDVELLRRLAR
jgi:hypothetical protein